MKKDINPPKAENIALAVIREKNEEGGEQWNAYFINLRDNELEGVLIRSNGYGTIDDETVKTSELRQYFGNIGPRSFHRIESILDDALKLNNQYWVTFFEGGQLLDRKFVFVPDSIEERNFTTIPIMDKKGILIK